MIWFLIAASTCIAAYYLGHYRGFKKGWNTLADWLDGRLAK